MAGAGRQQRAGELGKRWELLLPADSPASLQLGSSPRFPALRKRVKIILQKEGKNNSPGIHMKKERGMSGELKGLHNVASFPSSFLPSSASPPPVPPQPRGVSEGPAVLGKSSSRVSSRQFPEPWPRAPGDTSGNSRCHSKDGKSARPVTWGSPEAGGKSLESRHGTGKIIRGTRAWRFMPCSEVYYSKLFGFLGEREKEFATQEIPVVTTGI